MSSLNYVVISPVRNEAEHLPGTIKSMVDQTIAPAKWILVDDGSTDATAELAHAAARTHPWIQVLRRNDRGFRQAGGGVIDSFYDGFESVAAESWEYVVKFDGDLTFKPDYFERCFARFTAHPRVGIGGGLVCNLKHGTIVEESSVDPKFHVRGATKIYRQPCWQAIGGLLRAPGWDTLDEVKANMLGWTTETFRDIPIIHHRPAGGAYGTWPNLVKNGLANYIAGYHPLFMLVKCLRRTLVKPYGIGSIGLFAGFVSGYLRSIPQVDDRQLIRYFRQQQLNRLLGKPSLWS